MKSTTNTRIRIGILLWATGIFLLYLYYLGLARGGFDKFLKLIGV